MKTALGCVWEACALGDPSAARGGSVSATQHPGFTSICCVHPSARWVRKAYERLFLGSGNGKKLFHKK